MSDFIIDDSLLNFEDLKDILYKDNPISLSESAVKKIKDCRDYLDKKLFGSEELFYGINTGFGFLQDVKISNTQLEELQRNLLQSHACGMGEEVPQDIVKLMLLLKIKGLCYGHSGVSVE